MEIKLENRSKQKLQTIKSFEFTVETLGCFCTSREALKQRMQHQFGLNKGAQSCLNEVQLSVRSLHSPPTEYSTAMRTLKQKYQMFFIIGFEGV